MCTSLLPATAVSPHPQPAQDGAPCSHHSPSTLINKLPLITAVIAELFHSGNYSSQPDPGYLGRALSVGMAASQLISSAGLSVLAVPKCSTPGWQHPWGTQCPTTLGPGGTGNWLKKQSKARSRRDKALSKHNLELSCATAGFQSSPLKE